jgi:hypothetical protein
MKVKIFTVLGIFSFINMLIRLVDTSGHLTPVDLVSVILTFSLLIITSIAIAERKIIKAIKENKP